MREENSPSVRRALLICASLVALVAIIYWRVGRFDFINYDDTDYVWKNPHVQSGLTWPGIVWAFTTNHASNWHPLTWLSLMLDTEVWGFSPGAHHLVNAALHALNAVLLFAVLARSTSAPWRSAFVAAAFALHPLHVESVAWISERKDVLSACFWMLTMLAYVRYVERPGRRRYLLALGCYAFGLMTKPMLVTLPLVLLLFDHWPLRRKESVRTLLVEKIPFLLLASISSGLTLWAQRSGGAVVSLTVLPFGLRVTNAIGAYLRYLEMMLWPVDLAVLYPYQKISFIEVIAAIAILAAVSSLALWHARRNPHGIVGWLWFVGTLVPVIGFIQVGPQAIADRYTYLPLIGVFIMVAWSVPSAWKEHLETRAAVAVIAAILLTGCAVRSWIQVGYWENSETLFRHATHTTDGNYMAYDFLAGALVEAGRPEEAMAACTKSLAIKPDYAEAHYDMGAILSHRGQLDAAAAHYEAALQAVPAHVRSRNNLADTLNQQRQFARAEEQSRIALQLAPKTPEAHYNLGNSLAGQGRFEPAALEYRAALELKPGYPEAIHNLQYVLSQPGMNPAR